MWNIFMVVYEDKSVYMWDKGVWPGDMERLGLWPGDVESWGGCGLVISREGQDISSYKPHIWFGRGFTPNVRLNTTFPVYPSGAEVDSLPRSWSQTVVVRAQDLTTGPLSNGVEEINKANKHAKWDTALLCLFSKDLCHMMKYSTVYIGVVP